MALVRISSELGRIVCRHCQQSYYLTPALTTTAVESINQVRYGTGKHYDPKWRKLRGKKFFRMDLPDFQKIRHEANLNPDEMRSEMKKKGFQPPRSFQERNILISSTSDIFEPYVPPEGDGVASPISTEGAKQKFTELEKKGKSYMQLRKVRQFEDEFDTSQFAVDAQEWFIEAHNLLQNTKDNEERLHELVTEKAYPEMAWGLDRSTFRWKFIESLEPPRVVHIRTTEMLSKENLYAQVTVRLNIKQTLAIYDRFGRPMFGSEEVSRDCLEYVVFEKHLADEFGRWRIHGKVVPDWMPPKQSTIRTLRKPKFEPITEDKPEEVVTVKDSDVPHALATA